MRTETYGTPLFKQAENERRGLQATGKFRVQSKKEILKQVPHPHLGPRICQKPRRSVS